jgi:hypothetical protein
VQGVGPSSVLGGRYALRHRLAETANAERWSAHDMTLERDVVVVCFRADDPNADAALDAARRAAGVDNDLLVRILDVGRSDEVAFLVEEGLPGAVSATALLGQGGLPAEEARRIAGEVATALEAARARGLHHLQLTPSAVLRTADGSLKVAGLATAAALGGVEELDPASASRADAVAVVALTYALLTSRWPLPFPVAGLEPAPHVIGGVPAPSEIAVGVPGDLDALCRLTLREDTGPLTTGDFAAQIAPWARSPVEAVDGTSAPPTAPRAAGPEAPAAEGLADGMNHTLALPVEELREGGHPETEVRGAHGGAADGGAGEPGVPQPAGRPGRHEAPATGSSAVAGAVAGAVGSALGTAGQAAGAAAGRVGSFARAAADRAAAKAAERRVHREPAQHDTEGSHDGFLAGALEHDDRLEPPLPMLPVGSADTPTRDQSTLVVGIIAGFLVVATVIGFWGVSRIGSKSDLGLTDAPTPQGTVTVTGSPTTATPSPTDTGTEPATGEPLAILRATGFDPLGDGAERNGETGRVYDGDEGTAWSSEGYNSAQLGGLKDGVGVLLDLGQAAKPASVELILPTASDVTVYLAEERSLDGATELGKSSGKAGTVTITPGSVDAAGQYVIVWFTKVSRVDSRWFRATLAEVVVR